MLIFAVVLALLLGSPAAALGQGPRHFREAWEAGQRQDFDGAIMYYTRAIESGDLPHPDLFFAFNNRGNAYASKRDYDRAIRDYTEALRLNPKYAAAFRNRGRALVYKGDYDRAIADYNEAARLDPEDPHALIGRGIAYNAKHQYDLAIRDFDAALRVCPACPLAVLNRAAAYVGKGDDGRAIQEFDVALKQSPGDPNVYVGRAAVYEVRGEFDRAIRDLDVAIRLDPQNWHHRLRRGSLHSGEGDYARALEDVDAAVGLGAVGVPTLSARGRMRFYLGRFADAASDLAQARDADGAIWLYLARTRAGGDGRPELERSSRGLDLTGWPGKVVALYLGVATPEHVLGAARSADPRIARVQTAEAYFYLGELALLRADVAEARRRFDAVVDLVGKDVALKRLSAYAGAMAELRRLLR